jgi:NAD-dependent SIR2 family protein deacetylase
MMDDPIQIATKDLAGIKKFVALTGAGISVERTPL